MTAWELPESLTINNVVYPIRTDFRVILDIFKAMNDPDIFEPDATEQEKKWVQARIMLEILFEDFDKIPKNHYSEAIEKAVEFIDCGMENNDTKKPKIMDWEQDATLIIPAMNKVVGKEIRAIPYMHWWTFFSYYMEIGESLFSQVLSIRQKKVQHKKLEKWEKEFYKSNKNLIDLEKKYSEEQKKEMQNIEKWL